MTDLEARLRHARDALDRFESRIYADGIDLEELTDEQGAEYDALITAEREAYERHRAVKGVPIGTPL